MSIQQFVGVDYHTRYAIATRMNQEGTVLGRDKIANFKDDIRSYFSKLPDGSKVVLEATNNWAAFMEWTFDLPIDIKLANPAKTRAIAEARIKTDTLDSKVLADLLRTNFIAESYLAPKEVRDIRELVRYRMTLVRLRSQLKTRIRSVLFKVGERIPTANIAGPKARGMLSKFNLRDIYRDEINSCLSLTEGFTTQIEEFEEKIEKQANLDDDTRLLMTIPGISFFSALLITAEIGDYRRFPSGRKLCCFAGLVPSIHASGGKIRHGRIIKQGSANLRFALLQAIPHLIRKHSGLARHYQRISRKKGTKTARIAISRKLLSIMLTMLKMRQPFRIDTGVKRESFARLPASARASFRRAFV